MKKLLYIFLTVVIVGCSSDDDGGSVSFVGSWQLNSRVIDGVEVHDSCDLQKNLVLTGFNDGVYNIYDNFPDPNICEFDVAYDVTWSKVGDVEYLITVGNSNPYQTVLTNVLTMFDGENGSTGNSYIVFTKN